MSAKDADAPRARIHAADFYDDLKSATRDLVKAAGGPRRCERISRGDESVFSRYGARQEAFFLQIDCLADLEKDVGDPMITRLLAEAQGFTLSRDAGAPASTNWLGHLTNLIERGGDVSSGLLKAAADQCVTKDEALAEKARAIRLREDLTAYIASLNLIIDSSGT